MVFLLFQTQVSFSHSLSSPFHLLFNAQQCIHTASRLGDVAVFIQNSEEVFMSASMQKTRLGAGMTFQHVLSMQGGRLETCTDGKRSSAETAKIQRKHMQCLEGVQENGKKLKTDTQPFTAMLQD